jgi:hypothetical protein
MHFLGKKITMSEKQRKKAYVKMKIEKVRLVPQEAVLGICKTESYGGGLGLGGAGNCVTNGCGTQATS